jgi:hypothetical protein
LHDVADDELHAAYAAFLEAFEEVPPVRLGLAACDAAAEDGPLAGGGDADGGEYTFRVLTPWTYISATARVMARSLRTPRSRLLG